MNGARAPDAPAPGAVAQAMAALYDAYYRSADYQRRYPAPNRLVLRWLQQQGVDDAAHVLDMGCGHGRYTLPLLAMGARRITAFDISVAALDDLAQRLRAEPAGARVRCIGPDPAALADGAPYDRVLLLFGVLSHAGERAERVALLRRLRALIAPQGRLLLSVPNVWRRRPAEQLMAMARRALGRADGVVAEPGSLHFTRHVGGADRRFFYHLYSQRGLRDELHAAGFALGACGAESLLPEWVVTQHARWGAVDAALAARLPAATGYGFWAVAVPDGSPAQPAGAPAAGPRP